MIRRSTRAALSTRIKYNCDVKVDYIKEACTRGILTINFISYPYSCQPSTRQVIPWCLFTHFLTARKIKFFLSHTKKRCTYISIRARQPCVSRLQASRKPTKMYIFRSFNLESLFSKKFSNNSNVV